MHPRVAREEQYGRLPTSIERASIERDRRGRARRRAGSAWFFIIIVAIAYLLMTDGFGVLTESAFRWAKAYSQDGVLLMLLPIVLFY